MTPEQFELLLDDCVKTLSARMQTDGACTDSKEFETIVLNELKNLCCGKAQDATSSFHPHAFPDILVNGFGVEVKHTMKNSWLAVGNSIFEGMRDQDARLIYIVYGKMGGRPEVRWARYEDCVTHVRISHSPRFVVEMENPNPFFENIGVTYKNFSELSSAEKMNHVRQYARSRLGQGEQLWWLEELEEEAHSLPIAVRIYRHLPEDEKSRLRAEATLLCPEVLKGASARGKYDRAGLYLITRHGVFAPQLRDLFSAGSVGAKSGARGHKYIIQATRNIESEMRQAAKDLDDQLFMEYWGRSCSPDKRISDWLIMADKCAPDWTPSKELFLD